MKFGLEDGRKRKVLVVLNGRQEKAVAESTVG